MSFPILSLMLLVPVAAAIACLFLGNAGARWLALGATLANLALGIFLWGAYEIGGRNGSSSSSRRFSAPSPGRSGSTGSPSC
jgi:NADH:ubiquinone oxidoreductase subunit 4 (subunit M)